MASGNATGERRVVIKERASRVSDEQPVNVGTTRRAGSTRAKRKAPTKRKHEDWLTEARKVIRKMCGDSQEVALEDLSQASQRLRLGFTEEELKEMIEYFDESGSGRLADHVIANILQKCNL